MSRRPWRALVLLALPALVVAMDQNVLYLALPTLTAELGASSAAQLWVSDIYGLMVAVFLLPAGALGDRVGRRRLLLAGSTGFALLSLVAAAAPSVEVLIGARALLGVAGATIAPSSLGLIVTLFPRAEQRAKAIGLWMACFMVGIALGPSLGGLLIEQFWWGAVFIPGALVMLAVLAFERRILPESDPDRAALLDVVGAIVLGLAILSLVFAVKVAVLGGGGAGVSATAVVVGVLMFTLFLWRSRMRSRSLVPLRLFAQRRFSAAVGLLLLCAVLIGGTYFYFAQYLQLAGGLSPVEAGLVMILPAVAFGLGSGVGPVASRWIAPGQVLAIGLLVAAGGFAVIAAASGEGGVLFTIVGFSLAYLGFGPGAALGTDIIVGTASSHDAGAASAISETSTELGQALGIAAVGSVGILFYRDKLNPHLVGLDASQVHFVHQGVVEAHHHVPTMAAVAQAAFAQSFSMIAGGAALVTVALAAAALPLLTPLAAQSDGDIPEG